MLDNLEVNVIPDSVDNAVENLTDELTQTAGHTFSDIWYLIFGGISHAAEKKRMKYAHDIECYQQELSNKISKIPHDKLIAPNIQVTAQALENSKYCMESKELREMFSNLIANSCNIDYLKIMHPSFSNTLKCMSPYDAVLLKKLANGQKTIDNVSQAIEAAEYSILSHDSESVVMLHECIIFTDEYFSDFEMQSLSISTLKQLGILEYVLSGIFPIDKKFTETEYFKSLEKQYEGTNSYPVARQLQAHLTPYGDALINACSTPPLLNGYSL